MAPIPSGRGVHKHFVVVDCMLAVLCIQSSSRGRTVVHERRVGDVDGMGSPIHKIDSTPLKTQLIHFHARI